MTKKRVPASLFLFLFTAINLLLIGAAEFPILFSVSSADPVILHSTPLSIRIVLLISLLVVLSGIFRRRHTVLSAVFLIIFSIYYINSLYVVVDHTSYTAVTTHISIFKIDGFDISGADPEHELTVGNVFIELRTDKLNTSHPLSVKSIKIFRGVPPMRLDVEKLIQKLL